MNFSSDHIHAVKLVRNLLAVNISRNVDHQARLKVTASRTRHNGKPPSPYPALYNNLLTN
jgi:hypothetical protein